MAIVENLLIGGAGIAKDLHCRNWTTGGRFQRRDPSNAVRRSKFCDNEGSPTANLCSPAAILT